MPTTTNLDSFGTAAPADFHPSALQGHVIGGRVVIVDRHALVAQSLAMVLATAAVTTHVASDPSIESVLRQVRAFDPDLVLVDATADDVLVTIRALNRLGSRVLVIHDGRDRPRINSCLEAGAAGAVNTLDPVEHLLGTVRDAVAGRRSAPSVSERELLGELHGYRRDREAQLTRFAQLSTREAEVLEELMRGKAPADIATESYVSIATIRSQIKAILRKLEVNSQLAAVALAYQVGWSGNAFRAMPGSARHRGLPTPPR